MLTEDGAVAIVFNGEIYNFLELRAELEAQGHTFRTQTDTEVLLRLYQVEGEDCSRGSTACSPSPSGTARSARSSSPATAWASSLSTTR